MQKQKIKIRKEISLALKIEIMSTFYNIFLYILYITVCSNTNRTCSLNPTSVRVCVCVCVVDIRLINGFRVASQNTYTTLCIHTYTTSRVYFNGSMYSLGKLGLLMDILLVVHLLKHDFKWSPKRAPLLLCPYIKYINVP